MKTLYIMCGAPASGKTWFAKHNLCNGPGWYYVSRDEVRFSLLKDDEDYFSREEINSKIKEEMEDYILVKHPFLNIEKHNLSLFCIFDGHGGDFVSKYLKENFASNLHKNIKINFSLNFRNILKTSIESMDKEFEKYKEAENCGSTGTIVVLDNNFIYCANVGDSKCFYIRITFYPIFF